MNKKILDYKASKIMANSSLGYLVGLLLGVNAFALIYLILQIW